MVKAGLVCGKPPLALLPEREYERAILAQKHELPPHRLGFAKPLEAKALLAELLRACEISDIQTDMASLDGRHRGQRSHRDTPFVIVERQPVLSTVQAAAAAELISMSNSN